MDLEISFVFFFAYCASHFYLIFFAKLHHSNTLHYIHFLAPQLFVLYSSFHSQTPQPNLRFLPLQVQDAIHSKPCELYFYFYKLSLPPSILSTSYLIHLTFVFSTFNILGTTLEQSSNLNLHLS